ncbi:MULTISPECIES: YeiH family protein [Desulfosediminicola]|uniref:YeiH family protein n=1 Tax=Desulfosediminicola TaxID=2886823 RepID=UPI0010AC8F32|nr:YeiH family protein [Desulfosediminicola ganghwensis]
MQLSLRSSQLPSAQTLNGLWFVALFAMSATLISQHSLIITLGLSPLIIGILLGTAYGNTLRSHMPTTWLPGITFSTRPLLRFAIVLYGFRLTFQDILAVGLPGIALSGTMIVSTLLLGYFTGTRLLKMDRDTAFLTTIGSSICGAAAILAAEPVLKSKSHKSGIAVATVVVFGTIAMFLMPFLYKSGLLGMDEKTYGMFVGGTIHEVAHAVAAGSDISTTAGSNAIITKMIRVLMLAPVLIIVGLIFTRKNANAQDGSTGFAIPWFAVIFLAVVGFNSLNLLSVRMVDFINNLDIFLLTMTMCALGMETSFSKLKKVGPAPIYLAAILFVWLFGFGYLATMFFTNWL